MKYMKFQIVSEEKSVPVSRGKMRISRLVEFWFEILNLGYRIVDTRGGYVTNDRSYVHEPSYEVTVNAPLQVLPRLKLLARCIARLADQEQVWILYGNNKMVITKTTRLNRDAEKYRRPNVPR